MGGCLACDMLLAPYDEQSTFSSELHFPLVRRTVCPPALIAGTLILNHG
jgi:hypothetical protein